MTADSMKDLARRLVASPRWRWMPGMLATGDGWLGAPRVVDVDVDGTPDLWMYRGYSRGPATAHSTGDTTAWGEVASGALPDLTDPATVGCLLSLVREAWGSDHHVLPYARGTDHGVEIRYRLERLDRDGWNSLVVAPVGSRLGGATFTGATEAECLVTVLLHAPEVSP